MINLSTILKVLGVKITPEQVAQLEVAIPQIPQRAVQIIEHVNGMVARMDKRFQDLHNEVIKLRQKNEFLLVSIQDIQTTLDVIVVQTLGDDVIRTAGGGATGRLLEMSRTGPDLMDAAPGLPEKLGDTHVNGSSRLGRNSSESE